MELNYQVTLLKKIWVNAVVNNSNLKKKYNLFLLFNLLFLLIFFLIKKFLYYER